MKQKKAEKGSRIARRTAARLAAVQAIYQMQANDQTAGKVIEEFKIHRLGKPMEGHNMVLPDGSLFSNVVKGADERRNDLEGIIDTALASRNSAKASNRLASMEPLLGSILLCGSYELLAHHEIDAPVIITDYLEVTHAFYEGGEAGLVNAVLDHVGKAVRD